MTACGNVDDDSEISSSVSDLPVVSQIDSSSVSENSSSDTVSEKSETSDTEQVSSQQQTESSAVSSDTTTGTSSSVKDITGIYAETADGKDTGYVIISDSTTGYTIAPDAHIKKPLAYTLNGDKILVNRGGMNDSAKEVPFTFSDGTISFTDNSVSYQWKSIDFIPVHGKYYEVDNDGNQLSSWNFDGNGKGSVSGSQSIPDTDITYKQTADSIEITYVSTGKTKTYTYIYDVQKLEFTADDGQIIDFDADQSADTNN